MPEKFNHLFVSEIAKTDKFTAVGSRGGEPKFPIRDRISHAQSLINRFNAISQETSTIKQQRSALSLPMREGTYLEFESAVDSDLTTKRLEDMRNNIRLLNVRNEKQNDINKVKATLYIPKGKESIFLKKIQDYSDHTKDTNKGNPKNKDLVNSIEDVKLAILESFWPESEADKMPSNSPTWCEVWLRINDNAEFEAQINQFLEILEINQIKYKRNYLQFPERAVILIYANRDDLDSLILESDQLAEFRIGQEVAGYWLNENNEEQTNWVNDLLERLEILENDITVCILDSGVNNGHALLKPLIDDNSCLTVDPEWGTDDRTESSPFGHGTQMAGLIGYRNLQNELESTSNSIITHKLCSIKILPHKGKNPKELWGHHIEQAVSRAEINNPEKILLYCMAVTSAIDVDKGKPSSWSGTIDNQSFGSENNKRLFIISGGNITNGEDWNSYPDSNKVNSVQNPAQAWNALTIGAFTEKVRIEDISFNDAQILAPAGGLSPFSSTSFLWDKKWPIKPEVLFEGGNIAKKDRIVIGPHENLSLLTTAKDFSQHQFDYFNATSAATAQASWLAAKLAYKYPNIWPETIRALIVHSADWNLTLKRQFNITNQSQYKDLVRIAGYGIPNIDRALNSFENGLTFVSEATIQPYIKEKNSYKTNQMHFYEFPWPKDLLLSLGETIVKLRITLSYFIEPSPGEIGWKDKYRYQSFGFRFALNRIGEDEEQFRKRINKAARAKDEVVENDLEAIPWKIGKRSRDVGSIHSDIWEATAANISECNLISIYPVVGWWRERHNEKRFNSKCRYSLIVSLDTPSESVKLYSTVKTMIKPTVDITIPSK